MRSIKLHKLLDLVGIIPSSNLIDQEINNISFNSKEVQKGTLFLGMPGLNVDGGKFCIEAIENGAEAAIIGSAAKERIGSIDRERILVIEDNLDYIFGQIVAEFWNRPSRKLKLIGVTGTNGKTTITFLLEYLLKKLGKKTALFGTLFNRWPGFSEVASHTTDFADKLQKKLNAAVEAESEFAILEVSSHSIAQKRISGCEFEAAIFTNLTQDHLDYHSDMESYFQTKRKLFLPPYLIEKDGISVLNHDDHWISKLSSDLEKRSSIVSTKITESEFENDAEAAIIGSAAKQNIGSFDQERVLVMEDNLNYIFGQIVAEFWNRPSRKLKLIGVTGTNGKKTITFLLEYLLKKLGKKTALFGTLLIDGLASQKWLLIQLISPINFKRN